MPGNINNTLENLKAKFSRNLNSLKNLFSPQSSKRVRITSFVILFAVIGSLLLVLTYAASQIISFEAESANLSGVTIGSDAQASGGSYIQFGSGSTSSPVPTPDVANAPASNNVVLWMSIDAIDELSDAEFIYLRDNWGITTISAGLGYMNTMGGSQRRTTDTNATFNTADGRAGSEWIHSRKVKYGNNGAVGNYTGNGNIVNRLHSLNMKIYAGARLRNLNNRVTVLQPWFDDANWATLTSPTGPLGEFVSYAKAWGFDGISLDDEILNDGQTPEPTWKWNFTGNPGEAATRTKVYERGAQIGGLFASLWPNMDIIEYNTTGHGGFPDDWDEDFKQKEAGRGVDIKEPLVQRDLWDGVFSQSSFTGNLRFLNAAFYRGAGSGATWYGAEQYNAVNQIARLSRTWKSWDKAYDNFFVNPFHWPGHAANLGGGEDYPMSLSTIQQAFGASRKMGMGHIGFYEQSITINKPYYTADMLNVFRAAKAPGIVNTTVPTISAISQSGRSGNNIKLSGTAKHPVGIRYIKWEVFNSAGNAVESTGAFGHDFVPGSTGDHTDADGFADASYPFDDTISAPAGRYVRITAVTLQNQSHSVVIRL